MSLEIRVVPKFVSIPVVRAISEYYQLFGEEIEFRQLGQECRMSHDSCFLIGEYYEVKVDMENSVVVMFKITPSDDVDYEQDIVDEVAHEINNLVKRDVVESWINAGFAITLVSYSRRSKNELKLILRLALVYARMTDGWVLVMQSGFFDVPVGLYESNEFQVVAFG